MNGSWSCPPRSCQRCATCCNSYISVAHDPLKPRCAEGPTLRHRENRCLAFSAAESKGRNIPSHPAVATRLLKSSPDAFEARRIESLSTRVVELGTRILSTALARSLGDKTGLPTLCCYLLRHSFATDLQEKEIPDTTIAAMMGHRSTQMLALNYGHVAAKQRHLISVLNRVNENRG